MEVLAVPPGRRELRGRDLVDACLQCGDAVFLERVGSEPRFHRARAAPPLGDQLLEHGNESLRMNAGAEEIVQSLHIRLELVLPAESREHRSTGDVDDRAGRLAVADARQDAGEGDADVRALLFLHLFDCVPAYDMADLVAEHPCNFRHVGRPLDEPAVDVNESAGDGEGVYFSAVDDEEVPVEIAAAGESRNRITENVDVPIELRILDDR